MTRQENSDKDVLLDTFAGIAKAELHKRKRYDMNMPSFVNVASFVSFFSKKINEGCETCSSLRSKRIG